MGFLIAIAVVVGLIVGFINLIGEADGLHWVPGAALLLFVTAFFWFIFVAIFDNLLNGSIAFVVAIGLLVLFVLSWNVGGGE